MGDESVVIGVDYGQKDPDMGSQVQPRKTHKRKRASLVVEDLSSEQNESVVNGLGEEMKGLFGYYKEVIDQKAGFGLGADLGSIEGLKKMKEKEKEREVLSTPGKWKKTNVGASYAWVPLPRQHT